MLIYKTPSACVLQGAFPLSKATPLEARRGQVLIFSYLLVHGSYPNLSDRARRMLLIQVCSYAGSVECGTLHE